MGTYLPENNSMDDILGCSQIWKDWGVMAADVTDKSQASTLLQLFKQDHSGFFASIETLGTGDSLTPWKYGSILLGHHDNEGYATLVDSSGQSYENKGRPTNRVKLGPFDPVHLMPGATLDIHSGKFTFLRIGHQNDAQGPGDSHHIASLSEYPIDEVEPAFGCGRKNNWKSKVSQFNAEGEGRRPDLKPLPEGKLRPEANEIYGAHFLDITRSRVHTHVPNEFYWGGGNGDERGLLFVYDDNIEDFLALELAPNTLLYLGPRTHQRADGTSIHMPPYHGAVARKPDLRGVPVWVMVPGEWRKEVIIDEEKYFNAPIAPVADWPEYTAEDGSPLVLPHPEKSKILEGRMARPQDREAAAAIIARYNFTDN